MILEMDAGNSRVKWRIVDAVGESVESGTLRLERGLEALANPEYAITRVRLASVAKAANERKLVEWVRQWLKMEPEIARTLPEYGGLTIAYRDPQRLGVDRWLAMLAAYNDAAAPVCVIDAGSAVTIDLVDASGRHQGGYIVPGARLQRSALLRDTGQIQIREPVRVQATGWGCSTEEAVSHGIARMLACLVDSVLAELVRAMPCVTIYCTGGDAPAMMRQISTELPLRECPELVLDGLALALP